MLNTFDYRKSRYIMLCLMVLYALLLVSSFIIGNPFIQFPGYLVSWLSMLVFLILATIIHPVYRRLMAIPYVISHVSTVYYTYESLLPFINHQPINLYDWIGFMIQLVLFAFGLLAMILPLFIFLRKEIYQKPFLVVACVALCFQLISQSWYTLFLIAAVDFAFVYINAIRVILTVIPFVSIILYAYDAQYIHHVLAPKKVDDVDEDDELFGWLTLGIYTIYRAITKPYKK